MSVSGLNHTQRIRCRERVVAAAVLAYRRKTYVHYTQGRRRWDGIRLKRNARLGEYPNYADCSAFVTWCLWNGLYLGFGKHDIPNGANWRAGYTGTLLRHGEKVRNPSNILRGDYVIYGRGPNGSHCAIVVGRRKHDNKPMVISHGSEGGPYYLPYDYRSDIKSVRRAI